jgi:hypothetical protein
LWMLLAIILLRSYHVRYFTYRLLRIFEILDRERDT